MYDPWMAVTAAGLALFGGLLVGCLWRMARQELPRLRRRAWARWKGWRFDRHRRRSTDGRLQGRAGHRIYLDEARRLEDLPESTRTIVERRLIDHLSTVGSAGRAARL